MLRSLYRFFHINQYDDITERERVRFTLTIQLFVLVIYTLFCLFVPTWGETIDGVTTNVSTFSAAANNSNARLLIILPFVLGIAALVVLKLRHQKLASYLGVACYFTIGVLPSLLVSDVSSYNNISSAMLVVAIIQLGFFIGGRTVGAIVTLLSVAAVLVRPGTSDIGDIVVAVLVMSSVGVISTLFLRFANTARQSGITKAVTERDRMTTVTTGLSRLTITQASERSAVQEGLQLIQTSFPQIAVVSRYLLSSDGTALTLSERTGAALSTGQQQVTIGSLNIIGQAALDGAPRLFTPQSDVAEVRASLLDNMTSQMVLPIRQGDTVIGVLDLQTAEDDVLHTADIPLFQSIANSLGLMLYGMQQWQGVQQRSNENLRLTEQSRTALAEVERLNKRLVGRAWSDYLRDNTELNGIEYDSTTSSSSPITTWSALGQQAVQEGKVVVAGSIAAIPLRARGLVIGVLELELPADSEVNAGQLALMQELGERFGLAAENVRLLEQSQRAAEREALINTISSRIQSATNVEATLAETARSLNELLKANQVVIRLGKPERTPPSRVIEEIV